ncbi:hypothetical protein EYF80_055307 [Liparis tanakae]|uniref:Uncharacterized protein n=1 Tax=Liparis tanakae TaxID=230148 RepID=A0A4Z2F069_9TELE|nr:hypothetical protein EYF80_055307 [Liparis tanakae]
MDREDPVDSMELCLLGGHWKPTNLLFSSCTGSDFTITDRNQDYLLKKRTADSRRVGCRLVGLRTALGEGFAA